MRDIATSGLVADFLFGFGALFAIINPYGLAFIFLDKTRGLSEDERASLALRVADMPSWSCWCRCFWAARSSTSSA